MQEKEVFERKRSACEKNNGMKEKSACKKKMHARKSV